FPNPVANFSANPQQATILDPTIHFNDLSTGASDWEWNFGELSASSVLQNPVCVKSDFTFFMPNAFTPNANGLNDLFLPMGSGIDPGDFSFMVFDRWG